MINAESICLDLTVTDGPAEHDGRPVADPIQTVIDATAEALPNISTLVYTYSTILFRVAHSIPRSRFEAPRRSPIRPVAKVHPRRLPAPLARLGHPGPHLARPTQPSSPNSMEGSHSPTRPPSLASLTPHPNKPAPTRTPSKPSSPTSTLVSTSTPLSTNLAPLAASACAARSSNPPSPRSGPSPASPSPSSAKASSKRSRSSPTPSPSSSVPSTSQAAPATSKLAFSCNPPNSPQPSRVCRRSFSAFQASLAAHSRSCGEHCPAVSRRQSSPHLSEIL